MNEHETPLTHGGRDRMLVGARLLVLSSALLAAIGFVEHGVGWTMLTTALGPTVYVILAHPDSASAHVRNGILGHACAVAVGLALLAAFGLWNHPSVTQEQCATLDQAGAQALSVGITLLLLVVLNAHHAPAAATTLLITSGIARPGPPLYGLLVGLAATLAVAPLLARLPGFREATAAKHE